MTTTPTDSALQSWLQALQALLSVEDAVSLCLQRIRLERELQPCARPDAAADQAEATAQAGWLLRLDADHALHLTGGAADPAQLQAVLALCRAAWALAPGHRCTAASETVSEALYDLRNGLDTIVMSTALLAQSGLLPTARLTLREVEAGLQRSLAALERLTLGIE